MTSRADGIHRWVVAANITGSPSSLVLDDSVSGLALLDPVFVLDAKRARTALGGEAEYLSCYRFETACARRER